MQIPVEIAFHNTESSAAAESAIRDHVDRLDRIFGRGTTPGEVASYLVHALTTRKASHR